MEVLVLLLPLLVPAPRLLYYLLVLNYLSLEGLLVALLALLDLCDVLRLKHQPNFALHLAHKVPIHQLSLRARICSLHMRLIFYCRQPSTASHLSLPRPRRQLVDFGQLESL